MDYLSQVIQNYQVVQRDKDGNAHIQLPDGEIIERTVGGPYTIGPFHDILVGDLWVLAGQSNMEGCGNLIDVEKAAPFIHSFQSKEEWAIAEEPLHWLLESPRIVHHQILGFDQLPVTLPVRDQKRQQGAGLALAFAKEWYARHGVPVGLIPGAHGGTSMEQWDPQKSDLGDASLYGALLAKVRRVGGRVAGVLWYQGESETTSETRELYQPRMTAFVQALRGDLEAPSLPFYYVQIGRFVSDEPVVQPWKEESWNIIREAQRTWQGRVPQTAMVSTIDLELDDLIHIGTQGLKRLGRRLVDAADGLATPALCSVVAQEEGYQILITFEHVRGGLHAHGRPSGFSLRNTSGQEIPIIYKQTLEGNTVCLHLTIAVPQGTMLWYGWGLDPYCNVIDAADQALPTFGPRAIHE